MNHVIRHIRECRMDHLPLEFASIESYVSYQAVLKYNQNFFFLLEFFLLDFIFSSSKGGKCLPLHGWVP